MQKYIFLVLVAFVCIFAEKIHAQNYGRLDERPRPVLDIPFINPNWIVPNDHMVRDHISFDSDKVFLDNVCSGFFFFTDNKAPYTWKNTRVHVVRDSVLLFLFAPDTSFYCMLLFDRDRKFVEVSFFYDPNDCNATRYLYGSDPLYDLSAERMLAVIRKMLAGIVFSPKEARK